MVKQVYPKRKSYREYKHSIDMAHSSQCNHRKWQRTMGKSNIFLKINSCNWLLGHQNIPRWISNLWVSIKIPEGLSADSLRGKWAEIYTSVSYVSLQSTARKLIKENPKGKTGHHCAVHNLEYTDKWNLSLCKPDMHSTRQTLANVCKHKHFFACRNIYQ